MQGGRIVTGALIGLVVLAGCGGSSDSDGVASSPSTAVEADDIGAEESGDPAPTDDGAAWDNGIVELRVGDCYRRLPSESDDGSLNAEVVPCDTAHHAEVVSVDCSDAGLAESDPAVSAQKANELYASYVGLQTTDGGDLTSWLAETGLEPIGSWNIEAGCLSSLVSDAGDLERSDRASAGSSSCAGPCRPADTGNSALLAGDGGPYRVK